MSAHQPFLLLALCGAVLLPTTSLADTSATPAETKPVAEARKKVVQVMPVQSLAGSSSATFSGALRAHDRAHLAFQVSGTLQQRLVNLGDEVVSGQRLAVLNNPQLQPAVAAAQAKRREVATQAAQAKRDLQRVKNLHRTGAATLEEWEAVQAKQRALQAGLAAANAQLQQARALLKEEILVAPFAGRVSAVLREEDEFVAPGQPVIALTGQRLEVELGLPESQITQLSLGDAVKLRLPFLPNAQAVGRVTEISPAAGLGRLFPVVVSVNSTQKLRPGMTVEAVFERTEQAELTVPVRAVVDPGAGQPRVFRVVDGKVQRVNVSLGNILGERVIVQGDLQIGDAIVHVGLTGLVDGQAVVLKGAR